jgi:DNA-binding SARP family transcriptional activator/predicted ATPase
MSRLAIQLLGPFRVSLDGQPVTGFASDKVRALLAYLAVEADRPHRREKLVGLLWPDWPEAGARANLRRTLANLRQAIGDHQASPPFLLMSRQSLQFNRASDAWVDALAFRALLERQQPAEDVAQRWEQAVSLYGGDLLEGFSVKDSAAFEDWQLLKREQLQRQALAALGQLASHAARIGELGRACDYAHRRVDLEPWQEEAHQQLMRLLALAGRRSEALAQYEVCRRYLAGELGVEPAQQTTGLYQRIRDGKLRAPAASPAISLHGSERPPPFLAKEEAAAAGKPVIVARERELGALAGFLERALAGHGRVVFVAGEAGSGKTALIEEFARRAQEAHGDLVVAGGNGNAYTGVGDPYMPFREVLALLSGDVEARWAAGAISRQQATRLWNSLPPATQALTEVGPDLLDTFVSSEALLARGIAYEPAGAAWLMRLEELLEKKASGSSGGGARQANLFEQYGQVLTALAGRTPLLLVLDDLQWADNGSIDLLFDLGRRLEGRRILIAGAYRPEEITMGRSGPWMSARQTERHPLEFVLHELQREYGDIIVDVGKDEDRAFVEAIVDREPNRLGAEFRDMLYRQTRGHALFTVELLRGMEERGDLIQDDRGRWVEGPALEWDRLPPRVEGAIGQRIGRLDDGWRQALRAASVQGEVFSAEVLARVQGADERETVRRLSGELSKAHRLVRAESLDRLGSRSLSHYRFGHFLFQKYLYGGLDAVERARLHQATGEALEELYGTRAGEVAVQLARHFEEAGLAERAVEHLSHAGAEAVRVSANQEAIELYNRALALLGTLPKTPQRAERELALQLALAVPTLAARSWGAQEAAQAYQRARELSVEVGDTSELLQAMIGERSFCTVQAQHRKALELAEQIQALAQESGDPLQVMLAQMELAVALMFLGELAGSLAHAEQMLALYDLPTHRSLAHRYGQDPAVVVLSFGITDVWFLGYPEGAVRRGEEALALAGELDHPFTLLFAQCLVARLHRWRGDVAAVDELANAMRELAAEHAIPLAEVSAQIEGAWVLSELGQHEQGIGQFVAGLDAWKATGMANHLSEFLAVLAEMQGKAGQPEAGLRTLDEAFDIVSRTDERYCEAELYVLQGRLLLHPAMGDEAGAEASFQRAIEVALRYHAKMSELRATVGLCRLLAARGQRDEARAGLAGIYEWFTEGFDTCDLREAKALLDELECQPKAA